MKPQFLIEEGGVKDQIHIELKGDPIEIMQIIIAAMKSDPTVQAIIKSVNQYWEASEMSAEDKQLFNHLLKNRQQ